MPKNDYFTKKGRKLFKKEGLVLSFDPGTVNCGQALICSKRGIGKPRVHNFVKKKKDSLCTIIKRIHRKFAKDTQIQACVKEAQKTNGESPTVVIENQEGVSKGFKLALRMIRMGTVAGAIAMYFRAMGFKNVILLSKSQKWINSKKRPKDSKSLKKLYKKSSLYVIEHTKSDVVHKWIRANKDKSQHVHDAIVQGMYMFT